jgi:phosphate transport system substrate-binding protein
MLLPRLLTAVLALFTFSGGVWAEPITLKSTTSSVELVGELKSFDNEIYIIETDLGQLEVDARTVTCIGASCPKIKNLASEISISGDQAVINQLLIPLLESYSFSLDANIETSIETDAKSNIKIVGADEQEFANISINATNDSETDQYTLLMKSGTIDVISSSEEQASITPVAADALIAVTSDTNAVRSISLKALQDVLSGTVKNWKAIGGPDVTINVYLPSESSSLSSIAKEMGFDLTSSGSVERFDDLEELSKAVANDPYGLGFVNFANLRTTRALPILGNCGAYVQPTAFNIATGSYPASFYHYVQTNSETPPIFAREFLSYLGEAPAKSMVDRQGYPSLSVFENGLENQGNRVVHGLLSTAKSVPVTEFRSMLNTLNGARQLSTVLRFKPGTTDLDPQSSAALEALVSDLFLGNYADQTILAVGFTEAEGSTGENKRSSKAAAQLISRYIKDADSGDLLADLQIEVYGFGEASPLACEDAPDGAATNNRVEIWVKDNF